MFTIGEFSKITGLSIKTLRFYHEQDVLLPSCVDDQTGYRYYDDNKIETARIIAQLRKLDFSLNNIAEILKNYNDEADIVDFIDRHKTDMEAKMKHVSGIVKLLDQVITNEREARRTMQATSFEIEEKVVDTMLIAGVRMKGKYSECGKGFAQIGRQFGRHICGKAMLLIYDSEYKEDDADFETCMPIRKGSDHEGIAVRQLPGGRCVSLLHKGPYEELGRSYERVLRYAKEQGHEIDLPCREVYIKGPGMIFKGNPQNYLTEIQLFVKQ